MKLETVAKLSAIIVSAIVILGVIFGWFLKPLNRMKFEQTIDRADSQVFQQEQQVRHWKAKAQFEERKQPPTSTELEVIEQEEKRLVDLKKKREERLEKGK